jgi:hypothetical protein
MDLYKRLEEIELSQVLLGKYTGLLVVMYADKTIDKEFYLKELDFVYEHVLSISGIDSEEAEYIREEKARV